MLTKIILVLVWQQACVTDWQTYTVLTRDAIASKKVQVLSFVTKETDDGTRQFVVFNWINYLI